MHYFLYEQKSDKSCTQLIITNNLGKPNIQLSPFRFS